MRDEQNTPSYEDDSSDQNLSRRDRRKRRWERRQNEGTGELQSTERDRLENDRDDAETEAGERAPPSHDSERDRSQRDESSRSTSSAHGPRASDRSTSHQGQRDGHRHDGRRSERENRTSRESAGRPAVAGASNTSAASSRSEQSGPRSRTTTAPRAARRRAWGSLRSPWLRRARDPWSQTRRSFQTGLRRTLRQSPTALWMSKTLGWLSPSRLAALPELLGRVSRRIRARQPQWKQLAVDLYRSFQEYRPFDLRKPFAPLLFIGRRTIFPILVMLWFWLGRMISGLLGAMGETGKAIGAGLAAFGALLLSPLRWWSRLVASADQALLDGTGRDNGGAWGFAGSHRGDGDDRRSGWWALAAITGIVGVILTFILQFNNGPRKPVIAATEPMNLVADVVAPTERPRLEYPISRRKKPQRTMEDLPPGEIILAPQPEPITLVQSGTQWDEPPAPKPVDKPVPQPVDPIIPPELEPVIERVSLLRQRREADEAVESFVVRSRMIEPTDADVAVGDRDDAWAKSMRRRERRETVAAISYRDRVHPLDVEKLETDLKRDLEVDDSARQDADVQLSVSKRSPRQSSPSEPVWYELIVKNDSRDEVPQVVVEDRIPESYEVVNVAPLALLKDSTLRWQLGKLAAGEETTLRVELMPRGEGVLETTSQVRSFAAVNFKTDVAGPKLKLDVAMQASFRVGDRVAVKFKVTNTGTAAATKVVLQEDLPAELSHQHGRQLDLDLGTLEPGESREAQLTLEAKATGSAVLRSAVTASEGNRDERPRDLVIAEAPPEPRHERQPEPPPPRDPPRRDPAPRATAPRTFIYCVPTPICVP